MSGPTTFRITNINKGVSISDITPKAERSYLAPFSTDKQTAIVTVKVSRLRPRLNAVPARGRKLSRTEVKGLIEASINRTPSIDRAFDSITPLGAPSFHRVRPGERTKTDCAAAESTWESILRKIREERGTKSLPMIRFDVIFLTPRNHHPFDFWENGSQFWIGDFLINEGIASTRISIYGQQRDPGSDHVGKLLGDIKKFKKESDLGPEHSVILVEFLPPSCSSTNPLALETYRFCSRTTSVENMNGGLGVLLFSNNVLDCKEPEDIERLKFRSVVREHLPHDIRKLSPSSGCGSYQQLVTEIQELESYLSERQLEDDQQQGALEEMSETDVRLAVSAFQELTDELEVCQVINAPKYKDDNIDVNSGFSGIFGNIDFQTWLNPDGEGKAQTIQIVAESSWELRAFCSSLGYSKCVADGSCVLHIDCETLVQHYGSWITPVSIICGPLILLVFIFIASRQKLDIDEAITRLFKEVERKSGLVVFENLEAEGGVSKAFVRAIEELGMTIFIEAVFDVLCAKDVDSIIILSGLHSFSRGPVLGRIIRCIQEIQDQLECRVLFAYEKNHYLDGLLGNITCISDDERKECVASLHNNRLTGHGEIQTRHEKTLNWIWEDPEFKSWKDVRASALLLLLGKPACGKSVLSKFIVTQSVKPDILPDMDDSHAPDGMDTVVSFFFRGGNPGLCDRRTMLQAILHGILDQNRHFFPYFQEEYRRLVQSGGFTSQEGCTHWPEKPLEAVLERLKDHELPQTICIVIDGLDESTQSKDCAKLLGELGDHPLRIKLVVATQQDGQIKRNLALKEKGHFGSESIYTLILEEKNEGDIHEYAKSFLLHCRELQQDPRVIERCIKILVQKSQGIFLWAKLARSLVEEYDDGIREASEGNFQEFLESLPPEIDKLFSELFKRLLTRIYKRGQYQEDVERMRAMFQIAFDAKRELLIEEFRDTWIVRCSGSRENFSPTRYRPCNMTELFPHYTANLIEFHEPTRSVGLLHPSARLFLERQNNPSPEGGRFLDDEDDSSCPPLELASLRYLEDVSKELSEKCSFELTQKNLSQFAKTIDGYPFLVYAIEFAKHHISPAGEHISHAKHLLSPGRFRKLLEIMIKSPIKLILGDWMLKHQERLGLNVRKLSRDLGQDELLEFKNSVLHCAAAKGLATAVKIALKTGATVGSKSTLHRSNEDALCLAIINGQHSSKEVAQILLDHGANVNAETTIGGAPLHYASKFMNEEVTRLLLKAGADVNAKDSSLMTPLHRTVIGSRQRDEGLSKGNQGKKPRHASYGCVVILVEAGADLQAGDYQGEKPIHWAAGLNRNEILLYLIKEGGRLRRGRECSEGLSIEKSEMLAANEECLKISSPPLHWAAGYGCMEVVETLIKKGASIERVDDTGKTALIWAARSGYTMVLDTLIKGLKANLTTREVQKVLNQQQHGGRTALIWASAGHHVECIRLLADAGADLELAEEVDGVHQGDGTALYWALNERLGDCQKTVQCLLSLGARPNAYLLCLVASKGYEDAFKWMLDSAREQNFLLEADGRGRKGRTPFMAAAANGQVEMMKFIHGLSRHSGFLDSQPVDVHLTDNEGNSALLLAAGWGRVAAVEWLLDTAGLDIDTVNILGDTALHRAARWSHVNKGGDGVIEVLLERGANDRIRNEDEHLFADVYGKGSPFADQELY